MAIIDPIADMFTRIRNALQEKQEEVVIPFSKIKLSICKILQDEGFIKNFILSNQDLVKKQLTVKLAYNEEGGPLITNLKRVSKVSNRAFVAKKQIPKVLNGFGICIISTSKGVLSGRQARLKNVGGELIGEIY